jgi:adenosylmethionine-8-amino-7-oxononanoate aminotransferase
MSVWHPFTQHGIAGPMVNVDRAEGAYLYTKDGRRIIDAISSWWVNTHGHCHPKIVKAVQEQAGKLEQVIFAGFTHEPAERLAEKLQKLTKLDHVFFSDSGSTAVEVALKMAIGYGAHTGKPRQKIVALEGGYHGDTFGGMSAGSRSVFNQLYEPYLFDVEHLPFDDMAGAFEALLKKEGNNIAALIVEPLVQGAAGMKIYSAEILKKLSELCKKYDVLLIADEVMTGFGRTGTMFACEQAGVRPDIMCLSKGLTGGFLPMGATLCDQKIYNAFYSKDRSKMFFHSSSYTGNALACAAALASLEIWETEPVLERIQAIAKSHERAVVEFKKRNDIAAARHLGTILALDVIPSEGHSPKSRDLSTRLKSAGSDPSTALRSTRDDTGGYLSRLALRLYELFMEADILLRPLGNTVYILPPYCIKTEELEQVYDCTRRTLDQIRDEGQQRAA